MESSHDEIVRRAKADLAERLGVSEDKISERAVEETEFPDMALGAATKGEMSGQMMTTGLRIRLDAEPHGSFEYRADDHQLRLVSFKGKNYVIR